jgi:hypothetical protein
MKSILETIEYLVPILRQYDSWVKIVISMWILFTSSVVIILVFAPRHNPDSKTPPEKKGTGDPVIDSTLEKTSSLEEKGGLISESQLAETLKSLFNRPAFYYPPPEDNWQDFLYVICRTRLILEHYQSGFKTHKEIRVNIQSTIRETVLLERKVAEMYGPTFNITEHIYKYIGDKEAFVSNLPSVAKSPDAQLIHDRDESIKRIRQYLQPIGLID